MVTFRFMLMLHDSGTPCPRSYAIAPQLWHSGNALRPTCFLLRRSAASICLCWNFMCVFLHFPISAVLKLFYTGLLPGHLFSSGEMAGGKSKISSALNRLALEIPLDLYCVVFTNIIEHTCEWVQLPIINTLCQYRLTFQSVIFKIYSITRNSPTLKSKLSFGTNFLSKFLKRTTR